MQLVDVEMARYRVALVHGPPAQREALEASAAQRVQALTAKAAAGQER